MDLWNGFNSKNITLDGREAKIVFPNVEPNGKWALKTEYFDAFPDVQTELLDRGYHVAHISTRTRWFVPADNGSKFVLANYMHRELKLSQKCVIIGMSCGGMQGIYFACEYPQYVSCMYLDAPVVNFLSCPFAIGRDNKEPGMINEFEEATGMTLKDVISYRNQPLDKLYTLAKTGIPVFLVSGDSDTIVPYDENGIHIDRIYREVGSQIETVIKKGGDHHPHSLPDNTPILSFIAEYDK